MTATGIQICPASGTKAFAVYPAKRLHRKCQQNLLAQDFSDGQLRTREESGSRIPFRQFDLVVLVEHQLVALAEEKIEGLGNVQTSSIEAPRTHQLHRRLQRAVNPDFAAGSLRGSRPLE